MSTEPTLADVFNETPYKVAGHGSRDVQVLKQALESFDGSLNSDMYGKGKLIEDFQDKLANILGKESAVFFPSGTMAQQIALRIWCDRQGNRKVAYHPLCHLEIHEEDGLKELHHIEPVLLADSDRLINLDDVLHMDDDIACLLLELPQREIGGQLPDYKELEAISAYCREKGIKLHLDGARLFEIVPYYEKSAAEICSLFDSVYVSFYKGIGGIAGAILAGEKAFTEESKIWKRRHGGDLISLYPYILSSDYYYDLRVGRMGQYYEEAKELAAYFNRCTAAASLPLTPVSNMFHVHFELPKEKMEPVLKALYQETGVGLVGYLNENSNGGCSSEISIGDRYANIPKETLKKAFQVLDEKLTELKSS
ncbi:threonine aldolase family protein [Paenibacillus dakarensis]|uniref:threonine aldolase family protein n=1 Tax=Paenibacillus dakarensis TaxID=1527293 RepID=UPI0006D55B28|nr:beta-eliminating lyase-related protein [Paenibacillus dakarensis]